MKDKILVDKLLTIIRILQIENESLKKEVKLLEWNTDSLIEANKGYQKQNDAIRLENELWRKGIDPYHGEK